MRPKRPTLPRNKRGFSLVATVTMMVLLSLIAVGLLSLSSVTLRSSNADQAQLEARANARLALNLAIGQLQEAAGPDQRITAPATLVGSGNSSAVTGVWESLRLDPNGGQDLDSLKRRSQGGTSPNGEFVTWLNSDSFGGNPNVNRAQDFSGGQRVTLLDTPGLQAATDVQARVLPINQNEGGVAWTTIDESVKARFDLPLRDERSFSTRDRESIERDRLRNPERIGSEHVSLRNGSDVSPVLGKIPSTEEAAKLASFSQATFLSGTRPEKLLQAYNDLTPWSLGVLSNPVEGGLKKDLTTAFERPDDLTDGTFVYSQTTQPFAAGEPYMSTLREYYRLYRDNAELGSSLQASAPSSYNPFVIDRRSRTYTPNPVPVDGNVLMPVVSRVNVVFSLVGREAHDHWIRTIPNRTGDPERNYMVYLIYTPVVTLYNPYTKPITVNGLTVSFQHLPLAFRFFRNGKAQNVRPALLSQFHISSQNRTDWEDAFQATLSESAGTSRATPVTLQPGEARVFGLNHPAGTRWDDMTNYLFENDLHKSETLDITTGQGYNQGNSGFIVDWLCPRGPGMTSDAKTGVFGVRNTDSVSVEIVPKAPTGARNRPVDNFTVNIAANLNGERRARQIGAYRYTYGTEQRLTAALEEGEHPELGPITYPYQRERPWGFNEIFQPNSNGTPIENWTGPKQFAVFSMATRTSHDSLYPTKAGRDTSFVHNVLDMDITEAHPAQMPMEVSFLPVLSSPGSTNNVGSIEVWSNTDPRTFFFSGWSVDKGFTNYPALEIPRTPPTNLVQFRNANLASSGHLPMPSQTVGDSHASPLLPADRAVSADSAFDYATLDHAWLANNTLFDNFYLSGIRNSEEFEQFLNNQPIPFNSRSETHLPSGLTRDSAIELYDAPEGWLSTGAFQMLKGAFNVNSTSIEAWKALLMSRQQASVPVVNPQTMQEETVTGENPFPRTLDSSSAQIRVGEDFLENQVRWAGFRDLDEEEIENLAEAIVEVVRTRGPFTSMSEFVNRRLEGAGSAASLRGVLEQAILQAELNEKITADRMVTLSEAKAFEYPHPEAAVGNTESAAAAVLTQSDLLGAIGNSLTVRGDTFVIRAYGDKKDRSGRIIATAHCEAVVQRIPDFVTPERSLGAKPAEFVKNNEIAFENEENERFGRRFIVRSFRWLSQDEV